MRATCINIDINITPIEKLLKDIFYRLHIFEDHRKYYIFFIHIRIYSIDML